MAIGSRKIDFQFSKRLVLVNSASSVLARAINITVLFWVFQYLIRRIPAEEFAVYPVVAAIMVAAPLFFLVFSGGISRYVVAAHVKGDNKLVTGIVSTILPLLILASVFFFGVGLLFALNIDRVLRVPPSMVDEAQLMIILLVTSFAFRMIVLPFQAGFHVRQKFFELNLLSVGQELLKVTLLLVLLIGIGPSVVWVVVATVVSEIAIAAVAAFRGGCLLPTLRVRRGMFDRAHARELMSFGGWSTLGHLGTMMQTDAAVIILNLYATAVDVTAFWVGGMLYTQINRTMYLGMTPLQPVLTAMHSNDEERRLVMTTMRGGRYACWIALAIVVPLAIYANEFTLLYVGENYLSATWVIILLMVIQVLIQPTRFTGMVAIAKAKVRAWNLSIFLVMIVSVIGMIWTARAGHGAVGVAFILFGTISLGYALFFWPFYLKLLDVRLKEFLFQVVVPGLVPAMAGSLVWVLLKLLIEIDSWGKILLCSAAGGVAYLAVMLGGCLTAADRADLNNILRRLLPSR